LLLATLPLANGQLLTTPPAPTINGIKILESGYDPATKEVKLVFMNDRAADITAFHYNIYTYKAGSAQPGRASSFTDALPAVLSWQQDRKDGLQTAEEIPSAPPGRGDTHHFIHPGQKREITKTIDYDGVVGGTVTVDLVVWSDNTYQGNNEQLQGLIAQRSEIEQAWRFIVRTAKAELAHASDVAAARNVLEGEGQRAAEDKSVDPRLAFYRSVEINGVAATLAEAQGDPRTTLTRLASRYHTLAASLNSGLSLREATQ
jgi:hypothetical protein